MKKCFVLALFFTVIIGNGQDLNLYFNPTTIPSPNVASLGIFGQIPVDYATGVPDISIPVYVLKEGNISIPIIFKYHSSGLKPNTYPSWVGNNWTLFAGGSITRIVKWLPDENDNHVPNEIGYTTLETNAGYFYNTNLLSNDDWYNYNILPGDEFKDTEPDEFTFNFNGITGKFFLDHQGRWQVFSDHEIKIICTKDCIGSMNFDYYYNGELQTPFDYGQMFTRFTLLTEDGTQYIFGGNRKSIEFTRPECFNSFRIPTATTWNLTKIIPPEGTNVIDFEYVRDSLDLILYDFTTQFINETTGIQPCSNAGNLRDSRMVEPAYLHAIISTNTRIIFNSRKSNALRLTIDGTLNDKIQNNYELIYKDIKKSNHGTGYYFIQTYNELDDY